MHAIGLTPTSTGAPSGKETGEKVTHMIDAGGPVDRTCDASQDGPDVTLTWHDPHCDNTATKKKPNTRAKFTCETCGLNAWAKPGAPLICGDCEEQMTEEIEHGQTIF
jgi:hypothetical protein